MEEEKKGWFATKKEQFVSFCRRHPEGCLTVLGGLFTLAGGAVKLYTSRTEYDDEVYMIQDDKLYRVPAKELQSKKVAKLK